MDNSKYLINEDPVFFLPTLAVGIGLNEAILIQKIHGWLQCTPKEHVGRSWIYNSYKSWHEQLPFMSETAIKRASKNLIDKGIILTENFNKNSFDKTLWYSIDYEKLTNVVKSAKNVEISDSVKSDYREGQNGLSIVSKRTDNTNNNYNNKHNIKENNKEKYFDNEKLNETFIEWLEYKKQRKDKPYTEIGLKKLLTQIENNTSIYGEQAVVNLIDECMCNNYQGIIFDKLKTKSKETRYERERRLLEEMCKDE